MTHSSATLDVLFDGKLRFFQSKRGYRFSLDALLLPAFATVRARDAVADLGTGCGVMALILARRYPRINVLGIEYQAALARQAQRNAQENGFAERVEIIQGDIRNIASLAVAQSFDAIVCNPPYRRVASGRTSPNDERRAARHELHGGLEDFLNAAAYLARNKGHVAFVYLADRAVELLVGLRARRLEPKRVRFVHSFVGAEASLVLVEAVKAGRAEVKILPPLIVYREGKEYTDEVAAIIRG
ncbi:MAG: tRNA1(Val) (adenine(37)-N6)-methyltransferase [Deltaproteobacteria bacterium]|nr:tRNA1(Val) (adenine(37)-N6)-methyltransferase [Deltaproteobacteria bacterium]